MADKKIKVESVADTIETEKTKKQDEEARQITEKMKQAEAEAETARIQEEKRKDEMRIEQEKAEAQRQQEKEARQQQTEQLLAAGTAVAASVLKEGKTLKVGSFLKGLLVGFLSGILLMYFVVGQLRLNNEGDGLNNAHDLVLDNDGMLGYTVADFENSILGAASEHQELIVMEQPLSVNTTITRTGLASLPIFSKMKDVTYYGTGIYTVDLSHIDDAHIDVNESAHEVVIQIPHAILQYINPDLSKTEFQDTEKGWLAFGDITLTAEEQNELEQSVYDSMRERLTQTDLFEQADRFAVLKTWEIFQPLVTAVSQEFTVRIEFDK